MTTLTSHHCFQPYPPDAAGVISWIHLGDLHMTKAGEQNHLDLGQIVDEINQTFADSISFVYLPGDVADDGSRAAYAVVRGELDRLNSPWCAIVGDHDVHEKSFENFIATMSDETCYAFTVGPVRFIAINAFDVPHPASFTISPEQLQWAGRELQIATSAGLTRVLLLHCYPSDLKSGRTELMELVRNFDVKLIDMGHTHYNEIANDGRTLYTATRSTGQIEEGPVGYSIVSIDGDVVSWQFVALGKLPAVMITSPSDERLLTELNEAQQGTVQVRAKFWSEAEAVKATAYLEGKAIAMTRVKNSRVWEAKAAAPPAGVHTLQVYFEDAQGNLARDAIRIASGGAPKRGRAGRDQDNALTAWPERGLLGTQLGPNKNGKKW